jgi:hypothetical protein
VLGLSEESSDYQKKYILCGYPARSAEQYFYRNTKGERSKTILGHDFPEGLEIL